MTSEIEEYERRYSAHLGRVAVGLETWAIDQLEGVRSIDRVSARAKEPNRFAEKALKKRHDSAPRYPHPLTEVQDQIGLRAIVLYPDVVPVVSERLLRYARPIERKDLEPDSDWEFGYFGHHYILALPGDVVPEDVKMNEVPEFFELQVKTVFQHAWSEANHDLAYKPDGALTGDQQRLAAFAAAQAWGADRAFDQLRSDRSGVDELRGELTPLRNPGDRPDQRDQSWDGRP